MKAYNIYLSTYNFFVDFSQKELLSDVKWLLIYCGDNLDAYRGLGGNTSVATGSCCSGYYIVLLGKCHIGWSILFV